MSRSPVTRIPPALPLLLLFLAACGRSDGRSQAALDALVAVEELKAKADELDALTPKFHELREKFIKARADGSSEAGALERELKPLQARIQGIQEDAQRIAGRIAPELDTKINADPKDPGLREARSRLHETLGDEDKALEDLEAARAAWPKDAGILLRRAGIIRKLGRYEEARAIATEILKEDAAHAVAIAIDGMCLYDLNAFPTAVARLEEAASKKGRLEPSLTREVERTLEEAKGKAKDWEEEQKKRAAEAKADDLPRVKIVTSKGEIVVELFENEAPNAVANFIDLCGKRFYDETTFHRVIADFMVQGGDPLSRDKNPKNDGSGGPGYSFKDELEPGHRRHFRGSLCMANSGKDTNGSQFFITHKPTPHLDGKHVVFGRVIEGMSVVDAIRKGDSLVRTEIVRKRPHEYRPVVE
ncbi:MAG TPA: peptidylprolyl isomerase [Planctomycetota bacterium]|nr:peptidylprolyl isomerase [Planctomycetota bacterium]